MLLIFSQCIPLRLRLEIWALLQQGLQDNGKLSRRHLVQNAIRAAPGRLRRPSCTGGRRLLAVLARGHHSPAFLSRSMKEGLRACACRSASMRSRKSPPLPRASRSRRSTSSLSAWS